MKKIIIMLILVVSTLSFTEENKVTEKSEWKLYIGAFAESRSYLYKVDKKNISYLPVIGIEKNGYYLKETELGYKYDLTPKLKITGYTQIFGGLGLQGVGSSLNSKQLRGSDMEEGYQEIDDRKTQVEGGLKLAYTTDEKIVFTGNLRGGKYGIASTLGVSRMFVLARRFVLIPQANLTVFDKNIVNYYFGVSDEEVDRDLGDKLTKDYSVKKYSVVPSLGLVGSFYITRELSIFGLVEMQYASEGIGNSPLVNERSNYFLGTGLRYEF